jgi:hypothetical protein
MNSVDPAANLEPREALQEERVLRSLMAAAYRCDGAVDVEALRVLAERIKDSQSMRLEDEGPAALSEARGGVSGHWLSSGTGVEAKGVIRLDPVPTGFYHLLDPATEPLITVTLDNHSSEQRRVCVTAGIEGISAEAVKTIELDRLQKGVPINLLPALIPAEARRLTEVTRATLHVKVEIFGNVMTERGSRRDPIWTNVVESHDTYPLLMLSRNTSVNAVTDPATKTRIDLKRYYGAWVTPHVDAVSRLLQRAVMSAPGGLFASYQGGRSEETIRAEVKAIYDTLKQEGIQCVNSVLDYGAGKGWCTQRTRLPRESLRFKSANCIDASVLYASLLEGASIRSALVFVPGHAFVGWQPWIDKRVPTEWEFLETTMIGREEFDAARQFARKVFDSFQTTGLARVMVLDELRKQGIYPME